MICRTSLSLSSNQLNSLKNGFGVVIRNVGQTDVILSANISFHERQYPCTLADCCAESKSSYAYQDRYASACCAANFTASPGTVGSCSSCSTNSQPGSCHVYDVASVMESSSRGPAMSNYLSSLGEQRYKPDLVAPGSAVVRPDPHYQLNFCRLSRSRVPLDLHPYSSKYGR